MGGFLVGWRKGASGCVFFSVFKCRVCGLGSTIVVNGGIELWCAGTVIHEYLLRHRNDDACGEECPEYRRHALPLPERSTRRRAVNFRRCPLEYRVGVLA